MMGYCRVRSSPSSSPLRRVSRAEYPRSQETARLPSLGICIPTGPLVGQLPRSQEVSTISPAWRLPLCRHKARADRARGRDQAHLRPRPSGACAHPYRGTLSACAAAANGGRADSQACRTRILALYSEPEGKRVRRACFLVVDGCQISARPFSRTFLADAAQVSLKYVIKSIIYYVFATGLVVSMSHWAECVREIQRPFTFAMCP